MNELTIFGLPISITCEVSFPALPFALTSQLSFYQGSIGDVPCVLAFPDSQVPSSLGNSKKRKSKAVKPIRPAQIEKLSATVERESKMPLVLICKNLSLPKRRDLTQRGVSWVQDSQNFSIPFLAVSCTKQRKLLELNQLSASAAFIAVRLVHKEWIDKTTSEVAKLMGKTVASVGNYFNEIEAVEPLLIERKGRARILSDGNKSSEELFDLFLPYMPMCAAKRHYYKACNKKALKQTISLPISGISALAENSNLSDDPWKTYAACSSLEKHRKEIDKIESAYELVELEDEPDILIEMWQRVPLVKNQQVNGTDTELVFGTDLLIDCIQINEKEDDERVAQAIDTYKKEVFDER